jgi:membrane associated rhomboid family serine protease/Flp pilus assembly protein TadD
MESNDPNQSSQDLASGASAPSNFEAPSEKLPSWLQDKSRTPAINALIALNIAVFLAVTTAALADSFNASGGKLLPKAALEILLSIPADVLLDWGANAATKTVLEHQYWRLLSNTFLHLNLLHLGMNMYILWDFNRLIERLYGSSKFLTIYLLSGFGSSICSLIFLDPSNVSAGASGAIFGAFGATVAFFWAFRKDFPKKFFRMHQKMFFVFLIYCVVSSQMFPGMDNASHLGGFIVGLWTALCILPTNPASHVWAKGNFIKLACLTLVLVGGLELDIRLNRHNPKVMGELEYQRAITLLKKEHFQDALVQLKKAAQITPRNAAIYADEALAYSKIKCHEEAIEAATQALKFEPNNRKALAAKASALHYLGEDQQAIRQYSLLIQVDQRSAVALNNRAWSYLALNDPIHAIEDSTKALHIDSVSAAAYDTLGLAHCLNNQYTKAISDFAKCISLKPKDGAVYYHRAYAYLKQGDMKLAKADLTKARASDYQLEPWESKLLDALCRMQ